VEDEVRYYGCCEDATEREDIGECIDILMFFFSGYRGPAEVTGEEKCSGRHGNVMPGASAGKETRRSQRCEWTDVRQLD